MMHRNNQYRARSIGVYVHLPWCVSKCPYCDFNSHVRGGSLPEREYVEALLRDLDSDLELVIGRRVSSVFFGGGTPSLFSPESIRRVIEAIGQQEVPELVAPIFQGQGDGLQVGTFPQSGSHGRQQRG